MLGVEDSKMYNLDTPSLEHLELTLCWKRFIKQAEIISDLV